jgi:hypothetical protein
MMHLTPDQFVDAVEDRDRLDRQAAAHLGQCDACRQQLASLTEAWHETTAVTLPEPSPLFWDHFSRRVREATDRQALPATSTFGRFWQDAWRPVVTLAVTCTAVALVLVLRPAAPVDPARGLATGSTTVAQVDAAADDGVLSVVAAAAADLEAEELQQVARPSADATSAAIEDLTPEQRAEMVRLIKAHMKSSGAE